MIGEGAGSGLVWKCLNFQIRRISMQGKSLSELEQQRDQLFARLMAVGDFRRGSINETYRQCGKPNCACAGEDHPGHGPRLLWTRSVGGKTRSRQVGAGEVGKVRAELGAYAEFTTLTEQIVEVNELICEARPVTPRVERSGPETEKGGSAPS